MKEVTEAKFEDILNKQIRLDRCPQCKVGGGDILIRMPWYGKTGVCIKCPYCGHESKTYGATEVVFCGKRMATPFTEKSIMRGILKAVEERKGGKG